jgi:hypothetical protein
MKNRIRLTAVTLLISVLGFAQSWETNSDQWTATDALGRQLSEASALGSVKEDKVIGMFYWTWHTDGNADWVMPDGSIANITEILEEYPEAVRDNDHPAWQNTPEGGVYWWDEPLFGYYRTTDEWVLRKHAEMLADAGVDVVFFDCTNGSWTWKTSYTVLLQVWHQARLDGVKTPQVVFLLPFSATEGALDQLYELYTELYQPGLYQDLWFMKDGKPVIMAYPEAVKARSGETAGLKFTATEAFYAVNATCPSWNDNIGNLTFKLFRWNNSYSESVSEAPLVEKTFVNYNDNEKIQLSFDALEAGDYLWELSQGTDQVGVWKWTDSSDPAISYFGGSQVSGNYESEISYTSDYNFSLLTSGTSHEPVQLGGASISQQIVDEIKDFFTFRPGQPDYVNGPSRDDHWGWLENYPQHGYGPKSDGSFEQATVGIAQNASDATGGHAGGFNTPLSYGRSYTKAAGQDTRPESYLEGLNFQEQWNRAFEIDPDLIFITGWNEWIGGRWFTWDIQPFAFVDLYSAEKSRDIEPAKSWGNKGDVYYMQLVNNVRKFKGMQEPDSVSAAKTIDIDNTSSWVDVSPEYHSYKGNIMHRNHPGQGHSLVLTNTTGRNDIVAAQVARDGEYVYFYVETDNVLSPESDPNWMRLFIDIDRNKATGWEGYDFVVNRSSPNDSVLIEKSTSGWEWSAAGKAGYTLNEKSLVLKMKYDVLDLAAEDHLNFEFKWSDNMQEDGNIMDFYVNGDVAPGARFNYVYKVLWTEDGYHHAENPLGINQGLKCMQFNGIYDTLPAFNSIPLAETHYVDRIEIPAISSTDYALQYSGFLEVPSKDEYTFSLNCDLSSRLYIDDQVVVESINGQGEQSGSIRLMPGKHMVKLEYITIEGNTALLDLTMESTTISKDVISDTVLFKYNVHPEVKLTFKDVQNYFSEIDSVINVNGTDPDGRIATIKLYDNEVLIGEETTSEFTIVNMPVGMHSISALITDNDGAEAVSSILDFEVKPAFTVPGSIKVEEFRTGNSVVINESDDVDGGFNIVATYGSTDYPIDVSEAGFYQFTFRVPDASASKIIKVLINGGEVATVDVGNTGSDEDWYDVVADISLSEGIQILGFDFDGRITLHKVDIIKSTTGIDSDLYGKISVYPNPSSNEFYIHTQKPVSNIVVCDLLGSGVQVSIQKQSPFVSRIGSELRPGMYVLIVSYKDGSKQSHKIIKE